MLTSVISKTEHTALYECKVHSIIVFPSNFYFINPDYIND